MSSLNMSEHRTYRGGSCSDDIQKGVGVIPKVWEQVVARIWFVYGVLYMVYISIKVGLYIVYYARNVVRFSKSVE